MGTSRTRASRKYNDKAYERINFVIPKGEKPIITDAAAQRGMSVNAFILAAVKEKIETDNSQN